MTEFQALEDLLDPAGNFKKYREKVAALAPVRSSYLYCGADSMFVFKKFTRI
jgi:hypothetical protein